MAIGALTRRNGVRVGKRKTVSRVIELRPLPAIHAVALFAAGRDLAGSVVWRRGLLIILGVTGIALGRKSLKLARCRALMAGSTIQCGVRSHQGKPVLMLFDLLQRNHPSFHRMALLAVGSELAFVNVGMAIRALGSHVRKHRLGMALGARYALVHAAEGKLGQVVIELRNAADRFPARRGVAVLTRHVQVAVRAASARVILRLAYGRSAAAKQQKRNQQIKRDFQTHRALRLSWTRATKVMKAERASTATAAERMNALLNE